MNQLLKKFSNIVKKLIPDILPAQHSQELRENPKWNFVWDKFWSTKNLDIGVWLWVGMKPQKLQNFGSIKCMAKQIQNGGINQTIQVSLRLESCFFCSQGDTIIIRVSALAKICKSSIFEWRNWPKHQFCQIAKCLFFYNFEVSYKLLKSTQDSKSERQRAEK